MRQRRTKRKYEELWRNPCALFPPTANSGGVKVTLFPNGEREIWVQDDRGHGFRITAGAGKAGLGLQISRFTHGAAISVSGNRYGDCEPLEMIDADNVSLCQYNGDEDSQAFKAWYAGKAPYPNGGKP